MSEKLFATQDACKLVGLTPRNFVLRAKRLDIHAAKEERKPNGGRPQKFWTLEQSNLIGSNTRADVTAGTPDTVTPSTAEVTDISTVEPAPVVITLDERANRIRELQADVQRGIFQIGFELIAAKEQVGHGGWADWLKKEFEWTQRTANNFMRVADRFGKMENVFQFQPSALQAMLALPEGDEQEFIDAQAAAGTPVEQQSAREVQKNVKQFKQRQAAKKDSDNTEPVDELQHVRADVDAEEIEAREVVAEPKPAAEPLPAQMNEPDEVTNVVDTPAQVAAIRKLIDETDDLHALKTIYDSLLVLGQEIGKIVLLAEMKLGELAQKINLMNK